MAKEIFIHEWKIQDYSGRREQSMKSERTINGEHIYACKHLTSWFRLGKYLIKHDTANYLLGLTDLMSRQEFRDNVKCWECDEKAGIYHYVCCVDEIVAVVNKKFPAGDYVECLFVMQKALEGYEKCLYISWFYNLRFDYKSFLSDRDAYRKRLEDYAQAEHERELKEMTDIQLLYIDLFCGAGGTSTGVESARHDGRKCAKVIVCVNHDANAIASHAANHPDAVHFTEDIRTLDLAPMVMHLERMKKRYPEAHVVLWASLECTNFSKAKGGQPRDADSRTLAEHLFRYIEALKPDYIQIENVEEFMCWGDLDENGKPVSRYKGRCYVRWVNTVMGYGYDYDWRILNAADYGAYTSRRRFFGQFARKGLPIVFPRQTHAKRAEVDAVLNNLFPDQYKPWNAVRDVLDLQDEGTSIFGKKKPLCEKTLERIYAGLVKFVAGGKKQHEAWILKYNSMHQHHHNAPSIDEPCPTVAVQNRLGIVKVNFLSKQFSGDPMGKNQGIDRPAGTVTCRDHHAFVTAYFGNGYNTSIDEPNPTVTTKERHALVSADGIDLDKPMPDVPLDQVRVMTRRFIDNQYGNGTPSPIDSAAPTIVNNPKQSVVSADQFLANPFSYKSDGNSIDGPCFTLIARMDKMPPYLVTTEHGDLGIAIYESDSPMTSKVKEFMAMYGIIDVKMRMLNIRELKRIMGFPEDYTLVGTQAEQKKYIGNAVEVNMARVLCEALCEKLSND